MEWFAGRREHLRIAGLSALLAALAAVGAQAQPTVRVAKSYEDTVRILVITNVGASGRGDCSPATIPVGPKTLDFVKASLSGVPNVKFGESSTANWATVTSAFPGKMPHVIVHINAGHHSENGGVNDILNRAATELIGVVSIGDDAANFAGAIFGFTNVSNADPVMDDAVSFSRLWLELDSDLDTLQDPGVVRNTVNALGMDTIFFKPFGSDPAGDFRCQADADIYNVDPAYANNVSFLGFQGAEDNGKPVGNRRQWQVITTFQNIQRRGVALTYQPQFLANAKAAHQINYDAIMFASFAHTYYDPKFYFTDETGKPLPASESWSPAKGKLYLAYTDDYVNAGLSKTFKLSIRNRKGQALPDSETITVQAHVKQGNNGLWKAEIPLGEIRAATKLNGTAETFILGEITATVAAHTDVGLPDGVTATANLKVAYPDQAATVKIQDAANPATAVGRFTSSVVIQVQDQSFSKFPDDTLWVRAACPGSGDAIARLALVEKTTGVYVSSAIPKSEGAAVSTDAALACFSSDKITVAYADEVYGTTGAGEAAWVVDNSAVMDFTASDGTTAITGIKDGSGDNTFLVVVKGPTPTLGAADVLIVTLTTGSAPADVESVQLKETTPTSGIFVSTPVRFSFSAGATPANGGIEAVPSGSAPLAAIVLKGEASLGGVPLQKELQLLPSAGTLRFTAVDAATILNAVKDGQGGNAFLAVVRGASPSATLVDELILNLVTGADAETIKLTETSAASGIFVSLPIRFAFAAGPASGNGAVDAMPDPSDAGKPVVARGTVVLNGLTLAQDLPIQPTANLIKLAYIKDLDGNGAGDHVYFEFTRPLLALPAAIGPVYWNAEAAGLANKQPPRLAFLPGSNQTVIDADFSASPFPAGLTSIPPGATPHAVFPQDGIFEGQRPAIADSMGPVLVHAVISPYGGDLGQAGSSLDTLVVTVSEPLEPADWVALTRFAKPQDGKCTDYAGSLPVTPVGAPVLAAQNLVYTLLVASDLGTGTPFTGDCLFLDAGGIYSDTLGNAAPRHGIKVEGPKTRRKIMALQGYPPITGGASGVPASVGLTWIPPVGYLPGTAFKETVLPVSGSLPVGVDGNLPQPLPSNLGTVQVVTNRRYLSHVKIFDHLGSFITGISQSFGYKGEMLNPARFTSRGWVSYLVWDLQDARGQRVGQGAYIWKVNFVFEDGTRETRSLRMGVLRNR